MSEGGHDFSGMYAEGIPPWQIDRPQPEVLQLIEQGKFESLVLDLGCGTGDNTIELARHGLVVKGLDGCLTAYPQQAWAEIATKMTRLPQTDPKVRVYIRGMLSQAAEVKLDRQGRANLPRKLLERVGISDRMVVIGALDKIEFWNPEAWSHFMQQADSALEEVAASLHASLQL